MDDCDLISQTIERHVLTGKVGIVGSGLDGDDAPARGDLAGEHHRHNALVGAKIKDPCTGLESALAHENDFPKLRPVMIIPTLSQRVHETNRKVMPPRNDA